MNIPVKMPTPVYERQPDPTRPIRRRHRGEKVRMKALPHSFRTGEKPKKNVKPPANPRNKLKRNRQKRARQKLREKKWDPPKPKNLPKPSILGL